MTSRGAIGVLVPMLLLPIASCGEATTGMPAPQEITDQAVAEFCGMSLTEHPGPKAQILLKGAATPHWFASVHDAFAYTMLLERPKDIAAIYVNDMGKVKDWDRPDPGTWIDAQQAVFVIESRRRGGMEENEAVPFSDREAAGTFVNRHGGRLVSFAEMPRSYVLTDGDVGPTELRRDHPANESEAPHGRQ
jgi:copper chaperone NosL